MIESYEMTPQAGSIGPDGLGYFSVWVDSSAFPNFSSTDYVQALTFAATGNDWAADPDGSYTSNYATGEQTETTAHLSDYPARLTCAIIRKVG